MCLICEEEARSRQLRPVEKAVPALSGPVGGSVSYVVGLDAMECHLVMCAGMCLLMACQCHADVT